MKWPYAPVEFTTRGAVADPAHVAAAVDLLRASPVPATDVLLVAHGWNNGVGSAERMFTRLCDTVADLAESRPGTGRRWAVVGLLWPSLRWADDDRIAGGGLSAAGELPALLDAIDERVTDAAAAAELRRLAGELEVSAAARRRFVEVLRDLLPEEAAVADDDPIPSALTSGDPEAAFEDAAEAERAVAADAGTPAAPPATDLPPGMVPAVPLGSGTAGVGFSFADLALTRLARRLLNVTTYYTMKDRAGRVGSGGVVDLLAALPSVRVHLVGHSFGARVVTAAAAVSDVPVSSVTLLQGAFSHHGLSGSTVPRGAFRRLLEGRQLEGPVVATHTHNDKAVLFAYAVASRLAQQASSGLGDERDPYGGIGANGAVATAEADAGTLGDERTRYAFVPRRVANLRADRFVAGHGDVTNRAVANALLQAALSTTGSRPAGAGAPPVGELQPR